jgi:hypothetical protein
MAFPWDRFDALRFVWEMVILTWGLEKARETFIHGKRRKMNNHSLGNRQMCCMTNVS